MSAQPSQPYEPSAELLEATVLELTEREMNEAIEVLHLAEASLARSLETFHQALAAARATTLVFEEAVRTYSRGRT